MSAESHLLLSAGMALQQAHRTQLDELPYPGRRQALEQQMLALARTLRASHCGYARLYRAVRDIELDTVPPLDKNALIAHAAAFCGASGVELTAARRFLARPFELGSRLDPQRVLFSSSGSTGTPLLIPYHLLDLGRSLEAFIARAIAADRPEARKVLYIGLLDRHNGGNAWMHYLGSVLSVRMAHLFDPPEALLHTVLDFDPDVILTRPHLLLALGQLAMEDGQRLPRAHLLSVGDPLTAGAATEIAELWGTTPRNSYSTVETGPLGYQGHPTQRCLNLYDDLHLIELLDPTGRPVTKPGEPGRIAVTTLYRCQFPLVRYLIGDTSMWADPELRRIRFPFRSDSAEIAIRSAAAPHPVTLREFDIVARTPAGVRDIQLVQTAPDALLARYTLTRGAATNHGIDTAQIADALRAAIGGLLRERGLPDQASVNLTAHQVDILEPDHRTGKVQRLVPLGTPRVSLAGADAAIGAHREGQR